MSERDSQNIFRRLETENLTLKPLETSDKEFIFKQFSDPEVTRYLVDDEPMTSIENAEEMIDFYTGPEASTRNRWIIIRKSDNEPIGTCGYHIWNKKDNICETGYDLSPAYWGKGYMTEAMRRVITTGFEDMGLNRIQAFVDVRNTRSANLALRLGFTQEGIIRDRHFFRGEYYDHYCFSLLKREWGLKSS